MRARWHAYVSSRILMPLLIGTLNLPLGARLLSRVIGWRSPLRPRGHPPGETNARQNPPSFRWRCSCPEDIVGPRSKQSSASRTNSACDAGRAAR